MSRRRLLTGAGALVAAGTLGVPVATARTLSLPTSKRFKMSATTNEFFRSQPLHDATVMQSFAFDTPNNRLFAAQLRAGSGAYGTRCPTGCTSTCTRWPPREPVTTRPCSRRLTYREPEGMAVYGSTDATARLYFGFASGVTGDRRANLFYRNTLA
ncbi:hypothetical protein [Kribbella sp. NPDC049584]|uniref:hypothetical protein n=1 Tax=Kribbella sp. NPDC049584 TaxID=3154833 RepID=UPI003417746A